MPRSSISLGRWFGVELRAHLAFVLLLVLAVLWGAASTQSPLRGFGVFAALLFAVVVREGARIIAALYCGLEPRAISVFPVGSLMSLRASDHALAASRTMLLSGPIANFAIGALLLALSYAAAPGVHLFTGPWVSPTAVLRSLIWMQFVIALLGLLPATGLSALRGDTVDGAAPVAGPTLITGLALAAIAAGMLTLNIWLVSLGAAALMFGFIRTAGTAAGGAMLAEPGDSVKVRDVMLTESIMLSASDTIGGALDQALHSLQDVFPVLRGDRLVGSVSRQTLLDQMMAEGDGYLQGMMTRTVQTARPEEPVVLALRRAAAGGASEFIPVVDNGRMLGILTPQSLGRAVQQVQSVKRVAQREQRGE